MPWRVSLLRVSGVQTSLCCGLVIGAPRKTRDEDVQVILVGFQGDGNERSGHPSPPKCRPGSVGGRRNWGWGWGRNES